MKSKKIIKVISVISKNNKQRCPICNEYTSSIHDTLKPIELKYLKLFEQDTRILIAKRDLYAMNVKRNLSKK